MTKRSKVSDNVLALRRKVRSTVFAVIVLILSLAAGFTMLAIVWDGPVWVEVLVAAIAAAVALAVLFFTFRWMRMMHIEELREQVDARLSGDEDDKRKRER
mgnify:CR=1 FL=1